MSAEGYMDPPPGYQIGMVVTAARNTRWQFTAPDGSTGGSASTQEQCLRSAERHYQKSKMTKRKCLTCSATFLSEGPHNRMCAPCRSGKSEWGGV